MTGPFYVEMPGDYAIVKDRDGYEVVAIRDELTDAETVAEALCGALNSAPADQALAVTLANLAAGRHA